MMAAKNEIEAVKELQEKNFIELIKFSRFFGKFSNGFSLYILKILCFVILIDSFNMYVIKIVNVLNPDNLFIIIAGGLILTLLTSLDLKCVETFVQFFLNRVRINVIKRINDEDFEPPLDEIVYDLSSISYFNQLCLLYIPVSFFWV